MAHEATRETYSTKPAILKDCYIYISHLDEQIRFWKIPCIPDEISDSLSSTFQSHNALGRSAPVYTYSNSGPRSMNLSFKFHRDMMEDVNQNFSNSQLGYGEDYLDNLIHALQAIALPRYNLTNKAVEPPLVAIRITNEIFIKGIVSGGVNVTYGKPILKNGKWAQVSLGFTIEEVDPYDATSVYKNGSFRGMVATLKTSNITSGGIGMGE